MLFIKCTESVLYVYRKNIMRPFEDHTSLVSTNMLKLESAYEPSGPSGQHLSMVSAR